MRRLPGQPVSAMVAEGDDAVTGLVFLHPRPYIQHSPHGVVPHRPRSARSIGIIQVASKGPGLRAGAHLAAVHTHQYLARSRLGHHELLDLHPLSFNSDQSSSDLAHQLTLLSHPAGAEMVVAKL